MKLLPIALASLALGAGMGVALAYVEVGKVEAAFAPPPRKGELSPSALSGPFEVQDGPVAMVDKELYDFGTMQRGVTKSHEFVFTNTGTAPLTLEVGRTTCKCTLGEVSDKPLAPGESTPVKLEWVAKSLPGEFRQEATILTNDPRKPTVNLSVVGMITETSGLTPEEFLLGRISADQGSTAAVYLTTYEPESDPILVEAAMDPKAPNAEKYEFEVQQVEPADLPLERAVAGVKLVIKAKPGLPIGHVTEWVSVKTNLHDGVPKGDKLDGDTLQVPLFAVVEGDVSVRGAHWSKERDFLNFGSVVSRDGAEENLFLSFKGDNAATTRAEFVSADPEWLEVELGEPKVIRDGVAHQPMKVRIPPHRPAEVRSGAGAEEGGQGNGDAHIRLKTNNPSTPELDVRVRFVIAQ
jgi:hypothetical protein